MLLLIACKLKSNKETAFRIFDLETVSYRHLNDARHQLRWKWGVDFSYRCTSEKEWQNKLKQYPNLKSLPLMKWEDSAINDSGQWIQK